jgi:hypothetical protein
MQRMLADAVWDADAVRDDLRAFAVDELGDPTGVSHVSAYGVARLCAVAN